MSIKLPIESVFMASAGQVYLCDATGRILSDAEIVKAVNEAGAEIEMLATTVALLRDEVESLHNAQAAALDAAEAYTEATVAYLAADEDEVASEVASLVLTKAKIRLRDAVLAMLRRESGDA